MSLFNDSGKITKNVVRHIITEREVKNSYAKKDGLIYCANTVDIVSPTIIE